MPSPVGHLLAGLSAAVAGESLAAGTGIRRRLITPLALAAAAIAAAPDLDLVHRSWHRSATHSLTVTLVVMIVTAAVTARLTGRIHWRAVVVMGVAHASHILMDWLGVDQSNPPGLQALWPFSQHYYISGLDIFPRTERSLRNLSRLFTVNLRAAATEVAIVGPILLGAIWVRRRRRNRDPISDRAAQRQPSA